MISQSRHKEFCQEKDDEEEQHTILDPYKLVQHPLVRQLGQHRCDPVDRSINDDQSVHLIGELEIGVKGVSGGMLSLQQACEALVRSAVKL